MIGLVLGLGVGLAWVRGTSGNGYVHMIFTGAFICICTHAAQLRTRKHTLATRPLTHTHPHDLSTTSHIHRRSPPHTHPLILYSESVADMFA